MNESKITVSISNCKPGVRLAETIYNNYGGVIVAENTVLNEYIIDKLQNMDIDRIKVYIDNTCPINENKYEEQYNNNVQTTKNIIKEISDGKNLDINKVVNVVESIIEEFKENRCITLCLKSIRKADEYTYNHSVNVSLLSMMIGNWLKLDQAKIEELVFAGLLHDIGKAKIDSNILNKPGKLTFDEYEEMKKHVVYGEELIKTVPDINKDILMGIVMHHEREDGSGYILGACGENIHEYAKIIAVADIYDAMTSNRVYRERINPFEVMEHIQLSTYKTLDPKVGMTFIGHICSYYIGDMCLLNTGEYAEIIQINTKNISKPLVKIDNVYIDLSTEPSIKIEQLV